MGVCLVSPTYCIVTEYMHRGSLFDVIHNAKVRLDEHLVLSIHASTSFSLSFSYPLVSFHSPLLFEFYLYFIIRFYLSFISFIYLNVIMKHPVFVCLPGSFLFVFLLFVFLFLFLFFYMCFSA
jgi:hypothetical protein